MAIAQDGLDIALTVGDGLESYWDAGWQSNSPYLAKLDVNEVDILDALTITAEQGQHHDDGNKVLQDN